MKAVLVIKFIQICSPIGVIVHVQFDESRRNPGQCTFYTNYNFRIMNILRPLRLLVDSSVITISRRNSLCMDLVQSLAGKPRQNTASQLVNHQYKVFR